MKLIVKFQAVNSDNEDNKKEREKTNIMKKYSVIYLLLVFVQLK
jgi:hypothetical protein